MCACSIFKNPKLLNRCALVVAIIGSLAFVCGCVLLLLSFLKTMQTNLISILRWEGGLCIAVGLTFILGAIAIYRITKKSSLEEPSQYCVDEMQTEIREQNTLSYLQATDVDLVTGTDMEVQEVTERFALPHKHYTGNVRGFPGGYVSNIH